MLQAEDHVAADVLDSLTADCSTLRVRRYSRKLTYFSPVTLYFNVIASQLICESSDKLIVAAGYHIKAEYSTGLCTVDL